eukprot:3500035-Pyramimonas_sp.AAC.1
MGGPWEKQADAVNESEEKSTQWRVDARFADSTLSKPWLPSELVSQKQQGFQVQVKLRGWTPEQLNNHFHKAHDAAGYKLQLLPDTNGDKFQGPLL